MIDPEDNSMSIARRCSLLKISRSSFYYKYKGIKAEDLELMRLIDEQYLRKPVFGSRSMRDYLRRLGYPRINRKRGQRLMRLMGIEAIYPKPKTSKPHPEHRIYPYLLRELKIDHPGQVWCADITYIPLARGFMYPVAIMDWHSRKVLSWRVSNTLDADFCTEALQEAIEQYGCPEIFNTDQGSQFTSNDFTDLLKNNGIKISMDGRGRFQDNIFIERLWWTVKHHYVYLQTFENGSDLRNGLKHWFQCIVFFLEKFSWGFFFFSLSYFRLPVYSAKCCSARDGSADRFPGLIIIQYHVDVRFETSMLRGRFFRKPPAIAHMNNPGINFHGELHLESDSLTFNMGGFKPDPVPFLNTGSFSGIGMNFNFRVWETLPQL